MADSGRSVLLKAMATQRGRLLGASVLLTGHQAAEAAVPVLIGRTIERAIGPGDGGALAVWLAVLVLNFGVLTFCWRIGDRLVERANERSAHEARLRLAARILDPRGGAGRGRLTGDLLSVATSDAKRVGSINVVVAMSAAALGALGVASFQLLRVSIPLGLVACIGSPALVVATHALGKVLDRRNAVQQEGAAQASGLATDLMAGIRVVKGLGAEEAAGRRYRTASRTSLDATLKAAGAEIRYDAATTALNGCFLALVAYVAGRLATGGAISIGDLIASVGLAQFLLGPLRRLSWIGSQLAKARASAVRVAAVLAAPYAVGGDGTLPDELKGDLKLRGVRLGTLDAVCLEAAGGEVLGIAAADPLDALNLLDALDRTTDPDAGTVTIDGIDITGLDPRQARRAMLVAAHEADLFEATLAQNIAAGGGVHAGAAIEASAVDEVVASLPGGMQTELTEQGRSLSGGQRQRVALARALAAAPAVLVLHDPTTAVDSLTEERIAIGLRRIRAGRTTVIVTTSPVLLGICDRVVVLRGGRVWGQGTHAELARDGAYRELVMG